MNEKDYEEYLVEYALKTCVQLLTMVVATTKIDYLATGMRGIAGMIIEALEIMDSDA